MRRALNPVPVRSPLARQTQPRPCLLRLQVLARHGVRARLRGAELRGGETHTQVGVQLTGGSV